MVHRVVQTVVVWLASLAVAALLAAVPGMPTIGIAIGYVVALVVAERLSRRLRPAEAPAAPAQPTVDTNGRPDDAIDPSLPDDRADWRTFLPVIFATSTALIATNLSILDPPDVFVRSLTVVTAVAFGAFLVTDEVFRRRPLRR